MGPKRLRLSDIVRELGVCLVCLWCGHQQGRGTGNRLPDLHPAPHADTFSVFCPISKMKQDGPVSEHLAFNTPELGTGVFSLWQHPIRCLVQLRLLYIVQHL